MSDEVNPKKSPFSVLPEGCIANIISLTSPKDACRVAAVSVGFKSAADSDTVWDRFLTPNYKEIVSRASSPLAFSTKKQLYFLLRDSTLFLDGGKLSFCLNKSREKWYLMSARALQITAIDKPEHWEWTSSPESRFGEVAKLLSISSLEIRGIMPARMLSPNTRYVAWLKCMVNDVEDGLDVPTMASIKLLKEDGTETEGVTNTVYLVGPQNRRYDGTLADRWYGIVLGEFFIGEGERFDIQIEVSETCLSQKKGLIIEGIELRPNNWSNFEEVVIRGVDELQPLNLWNFDEWEEEDFYAEIYGENYEEAFSGEDEANIEEVFSGDDEANIEELLLEEYEANIEDEFSGQYESNMEEVFSGDDEANVEEFCLGDHEANIEELLLEEYEANIEEEFSGQYESNIEELCFGDDEANIEELCLGDHEANVEEEFSGQYESNIEELCLGDHEANIEELCLGDHEANVEEEFSGLYESNIEEVFSGEYAANFEEHCWGVDEANFEASWGDSGTYYEAESWGGDEETFYW